MLMIRNESSPAGEGRADEGNGACGGSRYVSALCGGVSSKGVGGLGRAVLDAAVIMEGLGFTLLRVPVCPSDTPNEVSESLYNLAVSKMVSISANESRTEGSTWRLLVEASTSLAAGGSATMRGSGVVSGTGIEDNGVLPVASCWTSESAVRFAADPEVTSSNLTSSVYGGLARRLFFLAVR